MNSNVIAWLSDKSTVEELKSILFGLNYEDRDTYAIDFQDDCLVIIKVK